MRKNSTQSPLTAKLYRLEELAPSLSEGERKNYRDELSPDETRFSS
jgi:hypothetical protein